MRANVELNSRVSQQVWIGCLGYRLAGILFGASLASCPLTVAAEAATSAIATVHLVPRRPPTALSVASLDFGQFYRFGSRAPEPTSELLGLVGKRVTLVGFMVLMEDPVVGGFYLSPYPAECDESGAGRGGVPPTSVLVLPNVAQGKYVGFVPGALEVTGVLEVGNQELNGEASTIRLIIDDVKQLKFARTRSTLPQPRKLANRVVQPKR